METFVCTIQHILFENPENGYTVFRALKDGEFSQFTVVAKMIEPMVGTSIKVSGEWTKSKYGEQFNAYDCEEVMPDTLIGIECYLGSGMIKGIGPIYAKKIVSTFGLETFNVLSKEPEKLYSIKGMGKKRCEQIILEWQRQQGIRDLMIFLKAYSVSTKNIIKIYAKYGTLAIELIKQNPYRLIDDIEGIGFKIADNIGLKMGIPMESNLRCKAGIVYQMNELCEEGDTYCERENLTILSSELLEVDDDIVDSNINEMIYEGLIVSKETGVLYLQKYYTAESDVAKRICDIINRPIKMELNDFDIERLEIVTGYKYEETQVEAIKTAMNSNIMVLTGGPGTGKTTTTRGIIEMLTSFNMTIALAAPTGKAAKRLSELTGRQAKTIHRLLNYNPATGFEFNEWNPLREDVLIVDEASMINILLMDALMRAVPSKMKVIIIGDVDQLPCIGSGNVLKDIIDSEMVPVIRLNKIFRQAQDSRIITNAHRVKRGENIIIDNSPSSDFFFLNKTDDIIHTVTDLATSRLIKAYGANPEDIQVLTPMKKCEVGTFNLNAELQKILNPNGAEMKYGESLFRVGDRVIQTVNNYDKDVFNGDSGIILSINPDEKYVMIRFDDKDIQYTYPEMDEIMLSYALTIHKSQGSEYPIVIIPITSANKNMMQRNLIYTAITRAKKVCVIVGGKYLIDKAIANVEFYKRKTKLKEMLCENLGQAM